METTREALVIDLIKRHVEKGGKDIDSAALHVSLRYPALCLHVLESIGSWPSSTAELAALQRIA